MLKNLRIGQKLLVIGLAFLVPIAVLLFMTIKTITKDIQFARWEAYGNEYQRPLQKLLALLPEHQMVARRLRQGEAGLRDTQEAKAADVTNAWIELVSVDGRLAEKLSTTSPGLAKRGRENLVVSRLSAEWEELATRLPTLTAEESDQRHARLAKKLRELTAHVGDTSNLILDPDLDSYYVMDVTLLALPQSQERLQEILAYGDDVLHRGTLTLEDRMRFSTYADLAKLSDLDRVNGSMARAFTEDTNFYGDSPTLRAKVAPLLKENDAKVTAFLDILKTLSRSEKATVTRDAFAEAARQALDPSFRLWDAAAGELDILLAVRTKTYRNRILFSLLVAIGALGVWAVPIALIMRSITLPLRDAVTVLSGSAHELISQAQSQSAGAAEQAAAVAEVTATVEELSRTAQMIAGSAGQVSRNAEENLKSAEAAHLAVDETAAGMETLKTKVHTLSERILSLGEKAREIGTVVTLINDFASDTHLLALNAAIEAAGAGEHGKRFAVVAAEVKRLAERVVQATGQIRSLVEEVQAATNSAVLSAEDGAREAERGSALAARSDAAINAILEQVQATAALAQEISLATQQQGQGSEQVARTMHDLSTVAQQAAATSQQSSASAEQLQATAHTLAGLVGAEADKA